MPFASRGPGPHATSPERGDEAGQLGRWELSLFSHSSSSALVFSGAQFPPRSDRREETSASVPRPRLRPLAGLALLSYDVGKVLLYAHGPLRQ